VCAANVRDGRVRSAILGGAAVVGDVGFSGRLGAIGTFGDALVLTAPVDGTFVVSVEGRDVARLSFRGALTPWDRHDESTVRFDALVGDERTDVLFVGEPPAGWLDPFDEYRAVVRDEAGGDTDWEGLQRSFAQARSRGDVAEAAAVERRMRRLARTEAVAPPESRR
jgi:hypothetical protein